MDFHQQQIYHVNFVDIVSSHDPYLCIMSLYNGFFVYFQCLFVDLCHLYTSCLVFLLLKIKGSWVRVLSPESCARIDVRALLPTLAPSGLFTKKDNPQLTKHRMVFNGRLANRRLNSLVKEATVWWPVTSVIPAHRYHAWKRRGSLMMDEWYWLQNGTFPLQKSYQASKRN